MAWDRPDLGSGGERLESARRAWNAARTSALGSPRPLGPPSPWGCAREGAHVQDVAAAGQVAPVGQGSPAQVHATFRPASSWRLATMGETEAKQFVSSPLPSWGGAEVGEVNCFLLPATFLSISFLAAPISVGPRRKPVIPKPLAAPLANAHPALGGRRLRRPLSVEHKAVAC